MKKYFVLIVLMFFAIQVTKAQNVFDVTDISQENDIYSGEENEAAVLIRCNHSIPLSFSSSMDKVVNVYMRQTPYIISFSQQEKSIEVVNLQ